jgi:thymidylate synthase (FAD)
MIFDGVCPEQARFILPQGCMVNWIWTGSLAAYARFYRQRTDPHAQKEVQQLARLIGDQIEPLFPVSWRALTNG